ncbi:GNAT family N-acetyltransferase [Phenylobacterium sp.]|uniref:GNAT family N-acetyltransferase n=1 Tax=Phenylobacterium sp. TaxID=1871053 RepID=UPI002F3ED2E5
MGLEIRPAGPGDLAVVYGFVRALADYEHLLDKVTATEADLGRDLFGPAPRVFADLVEIDGAPAGFALWYYSYSSFVGRHGIYLEDLFVVPEARGRGAGKALLRTLARRCVAEGLGRLEWAVLDWNAPSIAFYDSLGAAALDDWIVRRLTGGALKALAGA